MVLSYHKSIACLYLHQPDFVVSSCNIWSHVFQTRSFIKESRMVLAISLVLRSCWERTIREILSRPRASCFQSCFLVSLFACGSVFFVLLFVLRQYAMLFFNKTKKVHFLYISFFFSFTSVVMGKSLCRVHVDTQDLDSDKIKLRYSKVSLFISIEISVPDCTSTHAGQQMESVLFPYCENLLRRS